MAMRLSYAHTNIMADWTALRFLAAVALDRRNQSKTSMKGFDDGRDFAGHDASTERCDVRPRFFLFKLGLIYIKHWNSGFIPQAR
jgi:hypothetical protein